jgi:hypothetical protein
MPAGRPTKLTRAVMEEIVRNMASCAHASVAAGCAGVGSRTFFSWMRRGKEEPDTLYGEFRRGIQKAARTAEMRLAALVAKEADRNPDHAKWMLTHRFRERWAETSKLHVTAKVAGLTHLTDEELAARAEKAVMTLRKGDEG